MKSRYDFMRPTQDEENKTRKGVPYADIMSFSIEEFNFSTQPERYSLFRRDVERFDLLMFRKYGAAVYDDIILWLNNIPSRHFLQPGQVLVLPDRVDLDRFFSRKSR